MKSHKIKKRDGAALITVVAVFAFVSVLSVSVTSFVLSSASITNESAFQDQAYFTAKSVLNITRRHIGEIKPSRQEVAALAGKTASGELPQMGTYEAEITWAGESSVVITVTGSYKGSTATVSAVIDGIGGAD